MFKAIAISSNVSGAASEYCGRKIVKEVWTKPIVSADFLVAVRFIGEQGWFVIPDDARHDDDPKFPPAGPFPTLVKAVRYMQTMYALMGIQQWEREERT